MARVFGEARVVDEPCGSPWSTISFKWQVRTFADDWNTRGAYKGRVILWSWFTEIQPFVAEICSKKKIDHFCHCLTQGKVSNLWYLQLIVRRLNFFQPKVYPFNKDYTITTIFEGKSITQSPLSFSLAVQTIRRPTNKHHIPSFTTKRYEPLYFSKTRNPKEHKKTITHIQK